MRYSSVLDSSSISVGVLLASPFFKSPSKHGTLPGISGRVPRKPILKGPPVRVAILRPKLPSQWTVRGSLNGEVFRFLPISFVHQLPPLCGSPSLHILGGGGGRVQQILLFNPVAHILFCAPKWAIPMTLAPSRTSSLVSLEGNPQTPSFHNPAPNSSSNGERPYQTGRLIAQPSQGFGLVKAHLQKPRSHAPIKTILT